MSRVQPRTYEVAEANAMLPQVRRLVAQVVELGGALPDLEDQERIAQYRRSRPDATDADGAAHDRSSEHLRQAEVDLAGALTALEGDEFSAHVAGRIYNRSTPARNTLITSSPIASKAR